MKSYRRKVTLPSLGNLSVNFYSIANDIAELYLKTNEFERQKSIAHLGLIAKEVDGASHSRYEYLMMQCAISDLLDKLYRGLSSQGSLKINGKSLLGNGILKAWFMLSNFGHLKNTFGDEKTLLMYCKRQKGFKTKLLSPIRSDVLKEWAQEVINDFQYQNFHYVISLYRIYKEQPRLIERQNSTARLMEVLLVDHDKLNYTFDRNKAAQLKNLFKKIRDIAIVAIDGHYSHTPISIDLVSSIVSFDEIEGSVFGKNISNSLAPVRSLLYEEIYLNPLALANQRSYENAGLKSLIKEPMSECKYDNIIHNSLFKGINSEHQRNLIPFCRIPISKEIQPSTSFYDEFRNLTIRTKRNCVHADAYLDFNPYSKVRYADFFVTESFTNNQLPAMLWNILELIKDQTDHLIRNIGKDYLKILNDLENAAETRGIDHNLTQEIIDSTYSCIVDKTLESSSKYLFPLYGKMIWSVINYFIQDNFRIEIDEMELPYKDYSFSFPEIGDGQLMDDLNFAISCEEARNNDKAHEIKMLKHFAKRKFDGYKIACLVRIKIIDLTKSPENMLVTDIDSVLLKVNQNKFKLEFMEAKNKKKGRANTAAKELREKLAPILKRSTKYRVVKNNIFGAKLEIVQ